jgi:cytochrome d ubiquinol oxidase subunit II
MAVAAVAYLSAVYLVYDARRIGDDVMADYFRRRSVVAGVIVAIVAVIGAFVVHADATYLFDGLTSRALPLVALSVVAGIGALVLLHRDAARGARALAFLAVASIVASWGVAQWPYLLPESLTVSAAAAPSGTLGAILVAVGLACLIVVPGFIALYVLDQKGLLPEEGVADVTTVNASQGEGEPEP